MPTQKIDRIDIVHTGTGWTGRYNVTEDPGVPTFRSYYVPHSRVLDTMEHVVDLLGSYQGKSWEEVKDKLPISLIG